MRLGGIFSEAFAALRFNRQRSLLTVASLAWGVSCFVILYSYGEGFGTALRTCFQAIGQDLIVVFGGQTSSQAGGERAGRRVRLEFDDVQTIRDNVPLAAAASAELMVRGLTVVRGYRQQNTTIRAVEPPYGRVRNMTMASGRWLAPEDNAARERVAVIGAKAAEKLFGEIPPVGEYVAIGGVQFQIVGLLQTKLQISNYNTPDNQCIFIPYATAGLFKNIKYPDDIVWTPANPIFRDQAVKQVRAVLGRVHSFPSSDERAVEVIVFNEFMKMIDGMALALQVLLGFIGALTLAIGGIGLANIMLVSVTQRTREIGVLKSIGATRGAILGQFGRGGYRVGSHVSYARIAVAGADFQGHVRRGRHPFGDLGVRGCDVDGGAGNRWLGGGIAAGDPGVAIESNRGAAIRVVSRGFGLRGRRGRG